jgi:hypothetical protein
MGSARAAAGRYALSGLIERFGPSAALPDVLTDLAACARRHDFSAPCGARFTDLAARRSAPCYLQRRTRQILLEQIE